MMKYAAKQMTRRAKHCEKEDNQQKTLLKKAIQKGNQEGARIYASSAIRKRNEGLNYLRLAARFDAAASHLATAVSMGMVSGVMTGAVAGLDKALEANNLEGMSMMMDKFESQIESLGVQTSYLDQAIGNSSAAQTPAHEVDDLIHAVADEHGLELNMAMGSAPMGATRQAQAAPSQANDELSDRLNQLRNR